MSKVPNDMWICGACEGGFNLIALAKDRCPACGHQRDNCCIGPGEIYAYSYPCFRTIEYSYAQPNVHLEYNEGGAVFSDPRHHHCRAWSSGAGDGFATQRSAVGGGSGVWIGSGGLVDGSAGSPAAGSWVCEQCGAANSDLTSEFCPICGSLR